MTFPVQIRPTDAVRELVDLSQKAVQNLSFIRDDDIQIGATPKEAVYHEDNIILYRYTPTVKKPFKIPVLIVYALVNRPYMVDLQESRSLVRNLLAEGIDVYLIDWGYPQKGDRWLTIDDYVNGYIDGCIDFLYGGSPCGKHNGFTQACNVAQIPDIGDITRGDFKDRHAERVKHLHIFCIER